ncbi:hypothetical protein LPJ79_002653 [Coemansia sp. RSA 1821]|nr:hypothetical protein LPJ79_002653 [Coemansia sp. RSA 1821]
MPRPSLPQKRDFVAKAFCPRILVLSTPTIADACAVNGCAGFADLLAPFGQDISTQITIQDGQGAPYFLDKLTVRFTTDYKIEKHSQQQSRADIDELVHKSAADESEQQRIPFLSDGVVDADVVKSDDIAAWAPWYIQFRQQWVASMQATEHESFMHPVACLLVASGSEEDPIGALRRLQQQAVVQRVQSQSFSGVSVLFYYLLVHDGRDVGAMQTIDQTFEQVRRTFGQNSALVKINSLTDSAESGDTSDRSKIAGIWSSSQAAMQPLVPVPQPATEYGGMLSMRDVAALRDAVKQMMVRSVVPHMQYMIRVLSDQTANQRRGITGRLFSAGRRYFGAAGKTSSILTGVDGDVYFGYDSPEAQLRKLADYSFMLKDFRFAQAVYQVARRDFQTERAWKCYAGAQEMVGICKLMQEIQATRAEFDSNFDDAVAMYLHKTQTPCLHLAVRCTIIYYELLKHHRLYAFAPPALLRLPASLSALHAMISEQAAYAYLKTPLRPQLRKFSFYAMVASREYQKAGIGELAHRCLRMVRLSLGARLSTSSDKNSSGSWLAIESHVNHELGLQCMTAQNYDQALEHFMALMGSDQIPPKLQAKYLQELLQLYLEGSTGADAAPVQLSVPSIDAQKARVIMSPELEGTDEVLLWKRGGAAPSSQSGTAGSGACCSVGENVAVLLMVKNPLTVGITLSQFTLDCEFEAADTDSKSQPEFTVSTADTVVLEGGQTSMVTVTLTPQRAGSLTIKGASYLLCDILPAYKPLVLPGKRLNDTLEQRVTAVYAPETHLRFRVDPGWPRLEAMLEEFPDSLMSGSMQRAQLRLINRGTLPCHAITLWLSHPSFFDVTRPHNDSDDDSGQSAYSYTDGISATEEAEVANVLQDSSMVVVLGGASALDSAECLESGDSVCVPVWVRGDRVGAHALSMFVGASTAQTAPSQLDAAKAVAMRSRRFDVDLVVTPSLRVNAFVRPSMRSPHERIVGIEVENVQADLSVELVQTTFTSGYYELVPLQARRVNTASETHELKVGPRQTVNLMFRARPLRAAGELQTAPEQFTVDALQQYIFSKNKPTVLPRPITLIYSNAVLGAQGIDCVHSPLQAYILRSQAHRRCSLLRTAFPLIPEEHQPRLFPLYETFGIDFVLFWREIGGSMRAGHHSISGIDLGVPHDYITAALNPPAAGAARAWLTDTVNERDALIRSIANRFQSSRRHERPLDVAMHCVQTAESAAKLAKTPNTFYIADVTITVYNHSWRHKYAFKLDLLSPSQLKQRLSATDVELDFSGARSGWKWLDTTHYELTVPPMDSVQLHARLACCAPGMIDIALWELYAKALDPNGSSADSETKATIVPSGHPKYGPQCVVCRLHPLHPTLVNIKPFSMNE